MHPRWLVVVAVAGACVPVPPFRGEQQPALLTVNQATGEVASTTAAPLQYLVRFADRGARTPQSILVEATEVLREGACPYESGVGITVYPALTVSTPDLGGSPATGTLTFEWAGPVIARISTTWSSSYVCNGSNQIAGGSSTFTLFPNGRIVRHDAATPSMATLTIDGGVCGDCATDDKFNFSSFWNFQPTTQTVLPDGTPWIDGTSALGCAVYPGHTIGVGFSDPSHARLLSTVGSAAFVYDWEHEVTTLAPDERQTTTAILLSKESQAARCGEVTADLGDPPLAIGGIAGITTDANGIYPGPARQTARYTISSPGRLPAGFAVSLDLGAVPVVERSPPAAGAWYAVQPQDGRILVWFRDGLAVGETITIVPQ